MYDEKGRRVNIPDGTWLRLNDTQKARYTREGGEGSEIVEVETLKTVAAVPIKKKVVVPVVEKEEPEIKEVVIDDITGNPEVKRKGNPNWKKK